MEKYLKNFEKILNVIGVSLITLIFLCVLIQIIFRTFFNSPFTWPEEISQFLLIITVFIGAGCVERNNEHILVDIAMSLFPKAIKVLLLVGKIFVIVYIMSLVISEIQIFGNVANLKSKAAQIPMSYIHLVIVAGLIAWFAYAIAGIFTTCKLRKEDLR